MYEANSQANETPGLEDYLKAIQARKWLVIAFAIVGLILAAPRPWSALAFVNTRRFDPFAAVVQDFLKNNFLRESPSLS
jgi:hypothetical protein